ncbi:hypothetical protein Micbo1qcDRAFT_199132 [Microdochium bolleyi]|uniref:RWD domain-containing protein n=1 Tax=Microdochium bolleyi TaxID=196109 RepID=A0A136JGN2_9PEZI|nr:hypothetical protein Micbo1qcDRAFT_199132 [Microdochium bolleyi]
MASPKEHRSPSPEPGGATAEAASRLAAELEILSAMYPDPGAVTYMPRGRELRFTIPSPWIETGTGTRGSTGAATLVLRLPELYPVTGHPEILTASSGNSHQDLRDPTKAAVDAFGLPAEGGEEVLDALILAFLEVVEAEQQQQTTAGSDDHHKGAGRPSGDVADDGTHSARQQQQQQQQPKRQHKTVIIWLHHLLNTNKRKLALHPTLQQSLPHTSHTAPATPSRGITGVTKPGYPGVLLYSGPRDLVAAHVASLRAQRWQAFQVRYDSDDDVLLDAAGKEGGKGAAHVKILKSGETKGQQARRGTTDNKACDSVLPPGLWEFEHGPDTIVEVESISLAARSIKVEKHRETFLAVIGVK